MKFIVDGQQRGFFEHRHAILFEELLSQEELERLATALQMHSLGEGRDLWRRSAEVRSFIERRVWVETASNLLEEKPLRMGFDQWFSFRANASFLSFWEGNASLNEISSYQGIACGLLIPLFSNPSGQGLFVHPHYRVPIREWIPSDTACYLIAYLSLKAQYKLNRFDPCTAEMFKLGYTSGDRVSETLNPLVYR